MTSQTPPLDLRPLNPENFVRDEAAFIGIAADLPGEYWTRDHFLRDLPDKWQLSFAAYEGARPVAYAILSRRADEWIHLHHFMCVRDRRGKGLGTRLLEEMVRRCAAAGGRRLSLKVGEPRAQAFYRRNGFVRIGEENGHAVMLRRLGQGEAKRPVIAVHQPNYLPWLGYFHKIACADVFVFLEGAQFSKGSVTNRVRILRHGASVWLTQPVRQGLGQAIGALAFADEIWPRRHLDALRGAYQSASHFDDTFPLLEALMLDAPRSSLAACNRHLIEHLSRLLGLGAIFVRDGDLGTSTSTGTDRLIALVDAVAPQAVYLSGQGGAAYQDEVEFARAGIELRYAGFKSAPYLQAGGDGFVPGLSIVDALFSIGVAATRALIVPSHE